MSRTAACLLLLSLAAPAAGASDPLERAAAAGDAPSSLDDVLRRKVAATCDAQTPCKGCSGEACELCSQEELVKCCIHDGGLQSRCCAAANRQVKSRPVCSSPPAKATASSPAAAVSSPAVDAPAPSQPNCDVETPCSGCSGEQCELCQDFEQVKCCINDGGSAPSCCADVNPQVQSRPVCAGQLVCDVETPCRGCSGGQCLLCRDEEQVKCCIRDGNSQSSCCASANPQVQSRPVCGGQPASDQPACDVETPCRGCSGEQCELCRDFEQVKCCIREGNSASSCCADVNPQVQSRPVCAGQLVCDVETPCHGCSGGQCLLCRDEEQVKCCIRDGNSQASCCTSANPQVQSRPVCAGQLV